MALKNLFDMVKADRYTQDGREAIIKAQEAETEDKVYQIGEISQKTGLQKTANGWVKPKSGKQAGAKKPAEKHPPKVMPKGMSPAEFEKAWEDDAKKHGFEKGQGYEWREYLRKEEEEGEASAEAFADRVHKGEIKYNEETGKLEENKPAESKPAGNHPPKVMPEGMTPAEFMKAWEDDAKKNGFKKGQGNEWREHLRKEEAESKPVAQEVKLGGGADTYYFEDPDNMSNEDKVFKSLGIELAETFGDHDGDPGNVETWANAWLDNTQNEGGLGIKSKKTRQPAAPVPAEEVMKIVEENPARWYRIIGNAKKFYEGKGSSTDFESDESYPIKLVGGKTKPSAQYYAEGKRNKKNNPLTGSDAAPRILTGDTRIRVRKA